MYLQSSSTSQRPPSHARFDFYYHLHLLVWFTREIQHETFDLSCNVIPFVKTNGIVMGITHEIFSIICLLVNRQFYDERNY
jgi:hypothetical protein